MAEQTEQVPSVQGGDYPIDGTHVDQVPVLPEQTAQEESMEMGAVDQGAVGGMVTGDATAGGEDGGMGAGGDSEMVGEGNDSETLVMAPQTTAQNDDDAAAEECKMFVGGLNWETDEKALKQYFEQFGTVKEVDLKYNRDTNKSRGFAFVRFKEEASVGKVLNVEEHILDDRQIDIKKAIPHLEHQAMKNRTKKIFVGGVPTDMEEQTLKDYFIKFGEIEEVAIVTEKQTRRRRGFIFVKFADEEAVDVCTKEKFHIVAGVQVEVKRATPREQFPMLNRLAGGRGGGGGMGGRGRGGGGGGGGGYGGRTGWMPYGQYGYSSGQYYPPQYEGGWDGGYEQYGGYGGSQGGGGYGGSQGGGGRGGGGGGYSRYGPMKNYNQRGGSSYHPYSR